MIRGAFILKTPIINTGHSLKKLDAALLKNFEHGFFDFYLSFITIMGNLLWSFKIKDKRKITLYKKERDELKKTLENLIRTLQKATLYAYLREGKDINHFEIAEKTINHLASSSFINNHIIKRIVILNQVLKYSKLFSRKIFKTHKISCVWALVMKKKGRVQWAEIANLLEWFEDYYEGTQYAEIFKEEKKSFDSTLLKRAFYNLKKDYKDEMEDIKHICFEWDKRYELFK